MRLLYLSKIKDNFIQQLYNFAFIKKYSFSCICYPSLCLVWLNSSIMYMRNDIEIFKISKNNLIYKTY